MKSFKNHNKMKLLIRTILLFILITYANAQEPQFVNINKKFGISIRETNNICKDSNGFIWTGSKSGVLRISQNDYRIYSLPYKTADVLNVKLIFRNKILYAYSNNGQLFEYDEIYDRFKLKIDLRDLLKKRHLVIHDILVDSKGDLWIATIAGLYHYEHTKCSIIGSDKFECRCLFEFDDNSIGFIRSNQINFLNINTYKTKAVFIAHGLKQLNITRLFFDKSVNSLWIGTKLNGLYHYDMKNKHFSKTQISNIPNQPVQAININNNKTLLIGIDGQGVWELSRDGNKVLRIFKENIDNPNSLQGDGVYDIFCDSDQRVWISTYSGGLSYFDQKTPLIEKIDHQMNVSNSISNNNVNKVIEDKRGRLWFATNNGISRWDRSRNLWQTFYKNKQEQAQVFLALSEDNTGNIWAGTYSSGVYVLDGVTGKELMHFSQETSANTFSGNFIFDLFKDSNGDMWIGGVQGELMCYVNKTKQFRMYDAQPVKAIEELPNGKILLACTYGLLQLDKEKKTSEVLVQGYTLQDILVKNENIWIATSGDGLIRYDIKTKHVEKITTDRGLSSNYINSILYSNDNFWVGTENGLCKVFTDKNSKTYISTVYSLSNISFNPRSKIALRNGELVFGSSSGAFMFDPLELNDSPLDGYIFLQDIKVAGRSIREMSELKLDQPLNNKKKIELKYDQNTLDIELLPIGASTNGVKMTWKMHGLDKDWRTPSSRRIVTYTNIPSGKFKLGIKMYDNSLTKLLDEREIEINIIPPFYATWWFRLLMLSLLIALVYSVLKYYTNKLHQKHSDDKIRFFTTTAHDIRTSLTLIQAPIQELTKERGLSEKGNYFLNLASEQSSRLSFVATQLLDFQKVDVGKGQLFLVMVDVVQLIKRRKSMFEATAKKQNIDLIFSTNVEEYFSAIDELKIEKVVDNLISNAIKYSFKNRNIHIRFYCDEQNWSLCVQDYGLGISEMAQKKLFREFYRGDNIVNSKIVGSGIGLMLVKNYVSMHNGHISVESKENQGATFTISIPYKVVAEFSVNENDKFLDLIECESVEYEDDVVVRLEPQSEKRNHILIVEDNNDLQNFLKQTLEQYFKVSIASDGVQAWSIIQKKIPDFVVSDIMMPNMDGYELCKLIKSTFDTAHIPVILLTALSERSNQLEGLNLGADDYVTKPFDMPILLLRIKTILKNRSVVREKSLRLIKQIDSEEPIMVNELSDKFIKKAYQIVRDNMANCDFGKDDFASAMNASPSLLYKKIKALTGHSPVDFIKTIRLDYALELLQTRKYSITDVSEQCGFSSVGYFSTVFKKHFDKTPSEIIG